MITVSLRREDLVSEGGPAHGADARVVDGGPLVHDDGGVGLGTVVFPQRRATRAHDQQECRQRIHGSEDEHL